MEGLVGNVEWCELNSVLNCFVFVVVCVTDVSVGESITLRPLADGVFVETSPGVKPGDLVACMRVRIHGIPRLGILINLLSLLESKCKLLLAPRTGLLFPKLRFACIGKLKCSSLRALLIGRETFSFYSWTVAEIS